MAVKIDISGDFSDALKRYLDIKKNVEPAKEVRRRAKNIGMRLIAIYKTEAPTSAEIRTAVNALNGRVKIRGRILGKSSLSKKQKIAAEIRARIAARTFTATGWFPAVRKLGGQPRKSERVKGPERGRLTTVSTTSEVSEALINEQPGSEVVAKRAGGAIDKAMQKETEDMQKYIARKLAEAAKREGF